MNRCPNCMKIIENKVKCPYCNHDLSLITPEHYLRPGSILNSRYVIGRVIGQGGFGITYIGWDQKLEIRVAIKEYYPRGYVSRTTSISSQVTKIVGEDHRIIDLGKERFLKEARILAQLRNTPGVVNVQDYFEENQTAYIVMEFLSGITLKKRLESGSYDADTIFQMMLPVMNVVQQIHDQGFIHRDISPDNIILMDDGSLKLLDFGAAKEISQSTQETRTIAVAKAGYSPPEQYLAYKELTPASDIYSIFATIYKCITGITPEDSLERTWDDQMKWPRELGIKISNQKSDAIQRGMQVKAEDRFQSLVEVKAFLFEENSSEKKQSHADLVEKKHPYSSGNTTQIFPFLFKRPFKILCVPVLLLVIAFGGGELLQHQDSLVGQQETKEEKNDETNSNNANMPLFYINDNKGDVTVASYTIDGCEYSVRSRLKDFLENGWKVNKTEYRGIFFDIEASDNPDYSMNPYEQCAFLLSKGESKIVVVVDNNGKETQKAINCLVSSIYLFGRYDIYRDVCCSIENCIVNDLDIYNDKAKIENTFDIKNTSTKENVFLYVMPVSGEESSTVKHVLSSDSYEKIYEINCFKIVYDLNEENNPIMHIDIPTEASCYNIDYYSPVLETLLIDGESICPGVNIETLKNNGWEIVGDPNDPEWDFKQRDFIKPKENKALIMKKDTSLIEVYLTQNYDRNMAIDKCLVSGMLLFSSDGKYHVDSLEINGNKYESYEKMKLEFETCFDLSYSTSKDSPFIVDDGFICPSVGLFEYSDYVYLEFIGIDDIWNYIDGESECTDTNASIDTISIDGSELRIDDSVDVFMKDGWSIRSGDWIAKDKSLYDAFGYSDEFLELFQVMEKGDSKVLISVFEDCYTNLGIDMTESRIQSLKLDGVELKEATIYKLYDYLNIPFENNKIEEKNSVQFSFQNGYLTIEYDEAGNVLRVQIFSGAGVG